MTKLILNRRRFLHTAAAGSAAMAAPAYIRRAHAQGSGELNIWTYNNFIPEDFQAQFQEDTGIRINIRLVEDQGQQFNLLAAEAPNPSVDIVTVAGHRFLQFISSDLLAPLDVGRLTNWSNINPTYSEADWAVIEGERWGAPILSGAEVLAYNNQFVTAEEAQTWATLFSEDYANQTAYILQDMLSVVMLYMGYDGNMIEYMDNPDRAAEIVAEARDFLIQHKPLVRNYYDAGAQVQQMFVNQDIVLGHAWNGPIASLITDGFPVSMTIPQEGTYGFVYTFNIANNAPNAENAYRFLDALLASPEIGAAMTRSSGYISTFENVGEYLSETQRAASSFTQDELDRLQFFRAEANDMKYALIDPAVEQIRAA